MNCPSCQHPNDADARFCAQCGAPLVAAAPPPPLPPVAAPPPAAPPRAPAPAARKSGSNKLVLIILGVVLALVLLIVVGIYAAFHMVANKVRSLANGNAQTSAQTETEKGAAMTGNIIGGLLGTDAKGKADISSALNNIAQAGQQMEQHQKGADGQPNAADTQQAMNAAGGLLSAMGHSLGGAQRHDPVDFHALEAMLPTSVPGMQRGAPTGASDAAMGIKSTEAEVQFNAPGGGQVQVVIKDATAFSGLAGLAAMANAHESEQGGNYEKNETIAGRNVHETWTASNRHGKLELLVGRRFGVTVEGYGVDMDVLKGTLSQIDLDKLEAMKDANPVAQ